MRYDYAIFYDFAIFHENEAVFQFSCFLWIFPYVWK